MNMKRMGMKKGALLTLNTGSSSIKFSLHEYDRDSKKTNNEPENVPEHALTLLVQGKIEGLPHSFHFKAYRDQTLVHQKTLKKPRGFEDALAYLLGWIGKDFPNLSLLGAGHRIVHGGTRYTHAVKIDESVLEYLETLVPLAPLHQPHNLMGVRTIQSLYPTLMNVGCFDTAFHHTLPFLATVFALPWSLQQEGIRRYGFHGLSYDYIAQRLPCYVGEKSKGKVVVAHLGHGASMCALQGLKSIATTMGLTALDGLPMGTRCGTLDPGVILYLMNEKKYSIQKVTDLLYRQSGLLGLSGESHDMRDLLNLKTAHAQEAIDYFCYRIQRELGSLVAALEGLDVLVFTGGIGENSREIRQKVCAGLKWLGIDIDKGRHESRPGNIPYEISPPQNHPSVWVIPTNEERVIAHAVFKMLRTLN